MTLAALLRLFALLLPLMAGATGPPAAAPVDLAVLATVESDVLRIHGKATVPDGSWIFYAAWQPDEPEARANGFTRVREEQFEAEIGVRGWPAGEIAVDAHFQMLLPGLRQPPDVIERYGRSGERMTGDAVIDGGGPNRAAVASTTALKR